MNKKIALLPGDGIGTDVVEQGVKVLEKIAKVYNHSFEFNKYLIGVASLEVNNCSLPDQTIMGCKESDAVLLGAVGGKVSDTRWNNHPNGDRPEKGLLAIRKNLNVFANLRPAILHKQLRSASPLKDSIIGDGLDILIVRELTSDVYFGKKYRIPNSDNELCAAVDEMYYNVGEVRRILEVGFNLALKRNKKVCIVDKANVLEVSKLWREVAAQVAPKYPNIEVTYMYVDNASMQLIAAPRQFDVIITGNIFGDILSDEASMITGSIGMLPSASLRSDSFGLYEPIHGSAPDIAGMDKANPIATILSCAMMLRYSFNLEKEASCVENAVEAVLDEGYRTSDIMTDGMKLVGTSKMGQLIIDKI